ncbi:MAG TPA: hypothetical protein VNV35_11845 [Puia sp.]|nr:hypothetical protein [Puia sp.]
MQGGSYSNGKIKIAKSAQYQKGDSLTRAGPAAGEGRGEVVGPEASAIRPAITA